MSLIPKNVLVKRILFSEKKLTIEQRILHALRWIIQTSPIKLKHFFSCIYRTISYSFNEFLFIRVAALQIGPGKRMQFGAAHNL